MAYGRYLEEFAVGQVLKHWPGRTITEADCTWFALLTMNQHPVHSDAHYTATHTPSRVDPHSIQVLADERVEIPIGGQESRCHRRSARRNPHIVVRYASSAPGQKRTDLSIAVQDWL